MKEFLCRYGLLNGKYLSISLGGFAGGEELHKIKQSRQNGNRQRTSKIRVISFEVTCVWDCFMAWKISKMCLYWKVF